MDLKQFEKYGVGGYREDHAVGCVTWCIILGLAILILALQGLSNWN
jgi:hypothetical protein